MPGLPRPSSSGVRVAGDLYQWLIAWHGCLQVLHDVAGRIPNPVVQVGIEIDGAGNLDDVVLYRERPPHTYMQVKYAVDASSPLNGDYLLEPTRSGGSSILRKVVESWRRLTAEGTPVDLALITNRAPDPSDPLLSQRDSRTQLLLPKAGEGGARSERAAARARWCSATGLDDAELLSLLDVLRFDTARDPMHLHELVELQMHALGLRDDRPAAEAGAAWIARQVRDGYRALDHTRIRAAVDELGIGTPGVPRNVLSIATLKRDPLADLSDHSLDWVDRFAGDSDFSKRRPRPPATWAALQADIEALPRHLPPGTSAVTLTGSFRQATGFAIGAALREVTGIRDLELNQAGAFWSSNEPYERALPPRITGESLGDGDELAVAVAIAAAPVEDIRTFLQESGSAVGRLLLCEPEGGAHGQAIPNAQTALALAVGIRDTVRREARRYKRVHLFLIGPLGLAVLLGQRWNRVAPTTVYEDIQTELVYEPAFTIDA